MNLNKVKEFIMNEQSAIQTGKTGQGQVQYPREYDLVVKVESIHECKIPEILKVMTGGK